MLDEAVRRSTGALVKKVDLRTIPLLQAELRSRIRTRRLRGLAIARSMDAVAQLDPLIIELLKDEDHMIRAEAAASLAFSPSEESLRGLEELLGDRSLVVQEAARKSLAARRAVPAASNAAADFPEIAG